MDAPPGYGGANTMNRTRLYPVLLVAAGLAVDASLPAARPEEPVAIVYQVSGTASATADGSTTPIMLFARLRVGAVIRTSVDSRVTLAFSNGNRCELGPAAQTTLTAKGCVSSSGPVRRLSPVPPLPLVQPAVGNATKEVGYAAVRIRANEIRDLYPHSGATTLADETVLRFSVPADAEYHVKVMDQNGLALFESMMRFGNVRVPTGLLRPGARYSWIVSAVVPSGQNEAGREQFTTASADAANRRDALRKALLATEDASSLALLAGIDESLRLLWEAREELVQALAKDPSDENLRKAVDRVTREIATD